MKKRKNRDIPTTSPSEIEGLLKRVEEGRMEQADRELTARLLRLMLAMLKVMETKNLTISRLKKLLFGRRPKQGTESTTDQKSGADTETTGQAEESNQPIDSPGESSTGKQETAEQETAEQETAEKEKRKRGHGRNGADRYRVRGVVRCENPELQPGDNCPHQGCKGRVYDTDDPWILIQLEGRPLIEATRYEQQVLRCSSCQARFAASLPDGVWPEKYDATADAAITVMKYGMGMPWNRLERLQELVGVPLPASTQFERCEAVAEAAHPVWLELERQAAGGEVIQGDDTGVKILACMKENQKIPDGERKGLHTTGIGSLIGKHRVALYYSGRRHAGENLAELAGKRRPQLPTPIVMADAEFKNRTPGFDQIVAKCLQHGRRKFKEVEGEFPQECRRVIDDLRTVYRFDAQTREMTASQRLLHHQTNSKPILDELRKWIESQLDQHLVEPNSGLGTAMSYMLRHWDGLTCFLRVEGAPLDNNLVERMLKRAVLHRKNALFYKTTYGARVGDILMSLIGTCALNKVNPFDYLVALIRNAGEVRRNPARWLPWNYEESKATAA